MADKTRAVFKRILTNPIKLGGKLVQFGEEYEGNYDAINGLPGMKFIGFRDEMEKDVKTVISKDDSIEIVVNTTEPPVKVKTETEERVVEGSKEPEEQKVVGFSSERLEELKAIKPKDWLKKKKSEFIEILEEGNIDYSAVKDERMALYRFLVDIVSNL